MQTQIDISHTMCIDLKYEFVVRKNFKRHTYLFWYLVLHGIGGCLVDLGSVLNASKI